MKSAEKRSAGPQRRCLGCRRSVGKEELLRFVRADTGAVLWDRERMAPGRGAYLHPRLRCLQLLLEAKVWQRAFRLDGKSGRVDDAQGNGMRRLYAEVIDALGLDAIVSQPESGPPAAARSRIGRGRIR